MRKSFILHNDSLDVVAELTTEQKAELFQAIIDYNKGIEPELKGLMKAVFIPFRNQFVRDQEAYKNRSETNSSNGKKGGRPKKANGFYENQNKANGFSENQSKAKKAYNDSDSDNDSDNDSAKAERLPAFNFKKALIEAGADERLVNDWMLVRKNHRATNTQTAFNAFIREVGKSGLGINDILNECVIKSWRGFDADWLDNVRRADPNFVSKVKEYKRKLKDGGYYIDDVGGWENQSEFMAYTFMVPGNNTRGLVLGNKANVERRLTERPGWERLTPVSL